MHLHPIVGATVTCLSITALAQPVRAQVSGDSRQAEAALEEVVVTAQKRAERLQDVPISISAVSGDALDRSADRNVTDALNRVPSVLVPVSPAAARGGNFAISVRGVSAGSVGAGTTAYYLDNIPFGRATSAVVPDSNPYDLDRMEVLRGPQGTLYGASALNGVVRVLTKNPNFQDFEFKARASVSSTEDGSEGYTGDAAFNLPLIDDKLAARVILGYQNVGGWIDKPLRNEEDANDMERSNARVKLGAKLTDNFSVGLSVWSSRTDNDAPAISRDGSNTSPSALNEPISIDFDSYNLDLNYDTSLVSIRSATSYLDYASSNAFDASIFFGPGARLMNGNDSSVFTEELVLSSAGDGPWRWTLGSMYRDAQDDTTQKVDTPLTPLSDITHIESKSTAVFGELTRSFADGRFEVTGGLRYFRDKLRNWEDSRRTAPPGSGGIPPGGLQSINKTFSQTTPRVVLTWHPVEDATLYASYSEGFRSGFFQSFAVMEAFPSIRPLRPDTISNYEIGAKMSGLDGRLNFESALYYIDWQDVQQDVAVPINGLPTPSYLNGDALSGVGVDFAVTYAPVDALTLGLNVGWNDLTYDSAVTDNTGAGGAPVVTFPKGSRRSNSPEMTAGASIAYGMPLGGSGYRGRLSASANYVSEQITGAVAVRSGPSPVSPVVAYTLLKADATTLVRVGFAIEAPQHWTASLYVDNATNEDGVQPDPFFFGYTAVLRPRTYGVQFEYRY